MNYSKKMIIAIILIKIIIFNTKKKFKNINLILLLKI